MPVAMPPPVAMQPPVAMPPPVPMPAAPDLPKPAAPDLPKPAAPDLPKPAAPDLPREMRAPSPGRIDPTESMLNRTTGTARVGGAARVPMGTARIPTDHPPSGSQGLWSAPAAAPPRRDTAPPAEKAPRPVRDQSAPKPADAGGYSRRWITILSVVGAVVVLALCGVGGYYMFNNEQRGDRPRPTGTNAAAPKARDISSRDVDPAPLTEQEVFPAAQIAVGASAYQMLKSQAGDCPTSATDDLAALLGRAGCTQVVRATLKSPDGQYLITAGIFNLKDRAGADQAFNGIKPIIDAQKGRFTGLAAGDGTDAIVRAPTTLGWQPEGHFLVYCIVARADSKPIPADDAASKQLITDLVETHLRDKVIGARAVAPSK
jgi:hypothetical protein